MCSNEDWPVHLDPDDRRFFVLKVSEAHKEDFDYFNAIDQELDNGGFEALLYDLLNEPLDNFNPRRFPSSMEAFAVKLRSAGSIHNYIYEALDIGSFCISNAQQHGYWHPELPKDDVYADYKAWCQNNGYEHPRDKGQFSKELKKLVPSLEESKKGYGSRIWVWLFPSLETCQLEFRKSFGEKEDEVLNIFKTSGEKSEQL